VPVEAALTLPPGWKVSPETATFTALPQVDRRAGFTLSVPANWDRSNPRVALAADLVVDGQYLGEIAEAVADVQVT
jgi:hypothetical protein